MNLSRLNTTCRRKNEGNESSFFQLPNLMVHQLELHRNNMVNDDTGGA